MRIGLIIYGTLETLSGGYLYDRQLVQHLRAQGDEVIVTSLPWRNYGRHLTDNVDGALLRGLRGQSLDLLLQDELNHPSLFYVNTKIRDQLACPIISIVHHLRCHEAHPTLVQPLYRAVERRYLNSVDGFLYNSNTTRQAVQSLLKSPRPGHVAYPAADHLRLPTHEEVRAKLAMPPHVGAPLRLLFVGNLMARKGLHTVIEALAALPPGTATLAVIGATDVEPRYTARIQQLIGRHELSQWVTLHGRVSDHALAAELQGAHLLTVPSFEGFGIVYLEAMGWAVPSLATTAGAAGELIDHQQNGLLVPSGDAHAIASHILELAGDPHYWQRLAAAARRTFDAHPQWGDSMTGAHLWLHENFGVRHRHGDLA